MLPGSVFADRVAVPMSDPDTSARVTIDMRCGSSADCPTGFASARRMTEHGLPTTMACESE